jgi:hypothetical protein
MFSFSMFGIKFSKDSTLILPLSTAYDDYIGLKKIKADIENDVTNFIVNDTSWVTIEGIYKAKGGEKYITLGGPFYHIGISEEIERYFNILGRHNETKKLMDFYKKNDDILRLNSKYCKNDSIFDETSFYLFDEISVILIK